MEGKIILASKVNSLSVQWIIYMTKVIHFHTRTILSVKYQMITLVYIAASKSCLGENLERGKFLKKKMYLPYHHQLQDFNLLSKKEKPTRF